MVRRRYPVDGCACMTLVIHPGLIPSGKKRHRRVRINARLDEERAEKLRQLQTLTRLGASEIVKLAIDLLHRQHSNRSREKLDALLSSDFVGCSEGPRDLASRHKQYLTRNLEHKHGAG